MSDSAIVRFSDADLALFSAASGDRNPLHLNQAYAARTAYGRPVVFGALGCLASLRGLTGSVKRLTVDFQRPMFVGVSYRVEQVHSGESATCRVLDGTIPVLTASVKSGETAAVSAPRETKGTFRLSSAAVLAWDAITPGVEIAGDWNGDGRALSQLYSRWDLHLDTAVIQSILWSSYFVGMESPGENALFFRATFDYAGAANGTESWRYVVRVATKNPSLLQMRSGFEIRDAAETVATGQLTAFYRPSMAALRIPAAVDLQDSDGGLRGKTAVVVGASRGLGAALAAALALDGAQVVAVSRTALNWLPSLPTGVRERIVCYEQDASDAEAIAQVAASVSSRYGRVDYLFCSAFPAIPSLRLEPNASGRVSDYVKRSLDLVLAPLCGFLPILDRTSGTAVLISSAAVEEPVRDWPHYSAAKSACEQLFRVAPMQFPKVRSLIVRPNRLLTEMTNTPMGRQGAAEPFTVARQITRWLRVGGLAGTCEVLGMDQLTEAAKDEQAQPVAG